MDLWKYIYQQATKMKILNSNQVYETMKKKIYQNFASKVPQLKVLADQKINQAYTSTFSKNPVDTGTAKDNTQSTVTLQGRNLSLIHISEPTRPEE
jgi:hypothetical protein